MSINVLNWALAQPLQGPKKCVLLVLAHHANGNGICWPGLNLLSQECGISRSTIMRSIQALEAQNILSKKARHDSKGYRRSNAYQLNIDQSLRKQRSSLNGQSVTAQCPKSQNDTGIYKQSLERSKNKGDASLPCDDLMRGAI